MTMGSGDQGRKMGQQADFRYVPSHGRKYNGASYISALIANEKADSYPSP